eukprot:m.457173 g.457173  ORF g.457173 m.457173 type:complete len:281 (+) comp56981_c2_seq13:137-979(+)
MVERGCLLGALGGYWPLLGLCTGCSSARCGKLRRHRFPAARAQTTPTQRIFELLRSAVGPLALLSDPKLQLLGARGRLAPPMFDDKDSPPDDPILQEPWDDFISGLNQSSMLAPHASILEQDAVEATVTGFPEDTKSLTAGRHAGSATDSASPPKHSARRTYDCQVAGCGRSYTSFNGLKYHRQRAHEARHTSQTSPTTSVPLTPPSPRTSATRAPVNLADILACPLLSPRYAWLLAEVDLERLLPVILPQSRTLSDMLLLQLAGGAEWARKYAYRGQNA